MWFPESMYKSNKRLPVLVWANGTVCPPVLYYEFLSEVAAAGYIVVANTELFAGDGKEQKASIDFIISEDFNPESVFYGKVDETRIGVMGHSQGGLSSVNCANDDERVKCVLSIAGNSSESCASKLEVPTFFVTGSNDFIVLSSLYVEPSFNSCKSPAVFGNIKGAIHTSISFKPTTYSKYAIKWFDIHLKNGNKEEFKKQLLGDSEWSGVKFKNF
uniref:Carboxyl esterase family 7 n=1 Tax=Anaeromyces contortus TaxID=2170304 RepID=A0A2S1TZC8_9FUNG|nr:Carboxyl esterase family 7 [Anaeromyces contortus]